jgi:hypothetical protein
MLTPFNDPQVIPRPPWFVKLTTRMAEHFNIHRDELKHLPLEMYTDTPYKVSPPPYSQIIFPSEPYDTEAKTSALIIMLDPTKPPT